jgi:hypothetical protein
MLIKEAESSYKTSRHQLKDNFASALCCQQAVRRRIAEARAERWTGCLG